MTNIYDGNYENNLAESTNYMRFKMMSLRRKTSGQLSYKSIRRNRKEICGKIKNSLEKIGIEKIKWNGNDAGMEFQLLLPDSYLLMNVSYSDIGGFVNITAIYPFLYKKENELILSDHITDYNSYPSLVPIGKIVLKKNVNLIAMECQYICETPGDYNEEIFLTYFSGMVVSANRLYKDIKYYAMDELRISELLKYSGMISDMVAANKISAQDNLDDKEEKEGE